MIAAANVPTDPARTDNHDAPPAAAYELSTLTKPPNGIGR